MRWSPPPCTTSATGSSRRDGSACRAGRGSRRVDRQTRRVGIALVGLFGLLFVQLAYVQVFAADEIRNNPANTARQIIAEYRVQRGPILSADGRVLADSRSSRGRTAYLYERRYPEGPLYAALTGY